MLKGIESKPSTNFGGGISTYRNIFSLQPNQTPDAMNVKFNVGGDMEKRLGSSTMNATVLVSSAATGFTTDSGNTLSTNLVAWWKLDEANGQRQDQYGTNHLTQLGTLLSGSGVVVNAASYVAVNSQSLYITNTESLQSGLTNFTASAWFNLTSTGVRTILAKRDGSALTTDTQNTTFYRVKSDGSLLIGAGGTGIEQRGAQSFTVPEEMTITGCDIQFVSGVTGTPGSVRVTVETDSSGIPSGTLVDATSAAAIIFQTSIPAGSTFVHTAFSGGFPLYPGTSYWLVARLNTTPSVDTYYNWAQDTLTPTYANGNAAQFGNGAWTAQAGNDQIFAISGYKPPKNFEYWLYVNTDNLVTWRVSSSGIAHDGQVVATSFGAVSTATWYNAVAWVDSATNHIGVQVNLSATTASYTAGLLQGGSGQFSLGSVGSGLSLSGFMDGRLDESGFWRKFLSVQERSDLYNAGAGNTYNKGVSQSGYGSFDFGGGTAIRWHVIAVGTGIVASSNRGVTYVTIATDRSAGYQEFAFSKTQLIAVSDSRNATLVWPGSAGTFMVALAPNSAPAVKHAIDFSGYTFLLNSATRPRGNFYADNNTFTTSAWTDSFDLPANTDDEITDAEILNAKLYEFTKKTAFRISPVGGNPDFSVREVKSSFGAVPRTVERITLPEIGEVLIFLSWDKRVRIFDGVEDKVISDSVFEDNKMSPVSLSEINEDHFSKCFAEFDPNEQVYRLTLVMKPSTETTHCLCFNVRNGSFYWYDNQTFTTQVMAQSGNMTNLIGVKPNGFVHWVNTNNTDAGTPIADYYDSPFLFGKTPKVASKTQNIDFYFTPTSSGTLYFQDRTDFRSTYQAPRDTIVLADTTASVQTSKTINIPLTLNTYQYRLSSSASTADPWVLNRVDYQLSDLGVGRA